MTVRDATRRESPDGHVLYIEEFRNHLGIRFDGDDRDFAPDATKTRTEVIIIGHDMHADFVNMERDGIDPRTHFHYSGCFDTQVVIEDTDAYMGKSLSRLLSHYGLAELEWHKPECPKVPGRMEFIGSHCSANDAIKNLEGSLAQALDVNIKTPGQHSQKEEDLPSGWLDKPLERMNTNMVLLAYDTEAVETPNYKPQIPNRTSEHGFAWLRIADIASVAPGENGRNWRPFIRAEHYINKDFCNFKNRFYTVGNPKGFWPEYGKSQYYRVSEGPAPFHKLFKEISRATSTHIEGTDAVDEVTTVLENTTLEEASAATEHVADTRGPSPVTRGNSVRGRGNTRGTSARGNAQGTGSRGKNVVGRSNVVGGRGMGGRGKARSGPSRDNR